MSKGRAISSIRLHRHCILNPWVTQCSPNVSGSFIPTCLCMDPSSTRRAPLYPFGEVAASSLINSTSVCSQQKCKHTYTKRHIRMLTTTYTKDSLGFPSSLAVKNLPVIQETQETRLRPLNREDSLEEGMATHSSGVAGKIPWTEEPGWPWPRRSQRVRQY